jgi:hypothetical protein
VILRRWLGMLAGLCFLVHAAGTRGQSFNIDIDAGPSSAGSGAPALGFGGAPSQPGFWNSVPAVGTGPFNLLRLDGGASTVTLTRGTAGNEFGSANPGASGDFALLMIDGESLAPAPGAMLNYTISGLAPGMYGIVTYAWTPSDASALSIVSAPPGANPQSVGGSLPAPNTFALGVTHAFHSVSVTSGPSLIISIAAGAAGAVANGLQIIRYQSLNVDVGTNVMGVGGFGAPSSAFGAAAGLPGVWNNVTGTGIGPFALMDIAGNANAVTLTRDSGAGGNFGYNNGDTSGDFELLMDDGQDVGSSAPTPPTRVYTFSGLDAGAYTVYTYAWAPDLTTYVSSVSGPGGANPQTVGGPLPAPNTFALGITHALHDVVVAPGGALSMSIATPPPTPPATMNFGTVNGFQVIRKVDIAAANPPLVSPYRSGPANLRFRDVLQNTTPGLQPQGIGVAGTPAEGAITFATISVTFTAPPAPPPNITNTSVNCTDLSGNGSGDCPTITAITGAGVGPYQLTLSAPPPPRECITFTFAGTNAGQKLQYQVLPGDTNLDATVSTQDLLFLVQSVNSGAANLPENRARFNINRSNEPGGMVVTTQDFLREIQLLNGTSATQPFNGATVASCP